MHTNNHSNNPITNVEIKGSFIVFDNFNHPKGFVNKISLSLFDISMVLINDNGNSVEAIFAIDGSAKQMVSFNTISDALDFCEDLSDVMKNNCDIELVEYHRNQGGREVFKFINPLNVITMMESQQREFINMIIGVKGIDPNNKRIGFFQNLLFNTKEQADIFTSAIYNS